MGQGIPLLHPTRGLDGGRAKPKGRRMLVAPSHPTSDAGEGRSSSGQSGLAADSVEKSSLSSTLPWLAWWRWVHARTVWTPISTPNLTPTPSCVGHKVRRASSCTLYIRHLAVRRRSTSPIAMGRTPPLGFGTATSPAPARTGATARQAWPCASRFSSRVRCSTRRWWCQAALLHEGVGPGGQRGRVLCRPGNSAKLVPRLLPRARPPRARKPSQLVGKLRRMKGTQCWWCQAALLHEGIGPGGQRGRVLCRPGNSAKLVPRLLPRARPPRARKPSQLVGEAAPDEGHAVQQLLQHFRHTAPFEGGHCKPYGRILHGQGQLPARDAAPHSVVCGWRLQESEGCHPRGYGVHLQTNGGAGPLCRPRQRADAVDQPEAERQGRTAGASGVQSKPSSRCGGPSPPRRGWALAPRDSGQPLGYGEACGSVIQRW